MAGFRPRSTSTSIANTERHHMTRITILAILALVAFTSNAEARPRLKNGLHPECFISMPCIAPYASTPDQVRVARGRYIAREMGFGAAIEKPAPRVRKPRPVSSQIAPVSRVAVQTVPKPSISLEGVVPILADKVREIVSTCGSDIWSTVRYSFIRGTRILSQHASGAAVDIHGNPTCIYALLKGWPGGYSMDYARVAHVHISWGGREHGARFAHGGGRARHHRYASAVR